MINEVLDQLMYLRLKSAYTFLKELHINDGISQNELKGLYKEKNRLICYPMNKEDVCYTVPSTVSIIEDKAFYCCDFTEVNLSENT